MKEMLIVPAEAVMIDELTLHFTLYNLYTLQKTWLRNVFRKKTGLSGNISHTRGGGSDPFPLVYVCLPSFFFACQNHPEVLKNIFYFQKIFFLGHLQKKNGISAFLQFMVQDSQDSQYPKF